MLVLEGACPKIEGTVYTGAKVIGKLQKWWWRDLFSHKSIYFENPK